MTIALRPQVPLGDFMLSRGGSTDPSKQPNAAFVLYSIPAFDTGQPEFVLGSEIGSPKKNVRSGDILLSRIVPHIRRSWIVGEHPGKKVLASGEWIVFRSNRIDAAYLRHFLVSDIFHQQFMQTVAGVGGSLLRANPNYVSEITIPLPPLNEQTQIAAILDKADEIRRKRKRALDLLDSFSLSVFREALRGKWPEKALGELCTVVRGSSPRPQGDPRYFGGIVPRLMIADITRDGKLVTPTIDSLTEEGAKKSRPMNKGSVVMAVSGAVGLPAILNIDACIHDGFVGFRNLSSEILPDFLYGYLLTSRSRNQAQGTGAIWSNLTTDQVKAFMIPLPPVNAQRKLAGQLSEVETQTANARDSAALNEILFSSLQHRAFEGALL